MRLLAKFVESDYAKVDKLLEIREKALSRLRSVDAEIDVEKKVRLDWAVKIGRSKRANVGTAC